MSGRKVPLARFRRDAVVLAGMNVSRAQFQSHVSQTSQALHRAAGQAGGEFEHKVIADRCFAVDGFADKLERTAGSNQSEIKETSQARASSRAQIGRWAGLILGGAVVLGTVALGGPLAAGLMYGAGALATGVLGGELAKDNEKKFQEQLSTFGQEIAQGQPADATSGLKLEGGGVPGLMTNDEWLLRSLPPRGFD